MNRIIKSRLSGIAVVLVLPLIFVGCSTCDDVCQFVCFPFILIFPLAVACVYVCLDACEKQQTSFDCTDNPDACAASFEQMQVAAIEFCEEYPEECQEAFDAWVESLDEAEE